MEPITTTLTNTSNRLIEHKTLTSTRSNRLIDYESVIDKELVVSGWERRHYKAIHKLGIPGYQELMYKARKYGNGPGKSPQKLLAFLVGQALVDSKR